MPIWDFIGGRGRDMVSCARTLQRFDLIRQGGFERWSFPS